jgi:hypothetical protein
VLLAASFVIAVGGLAPEIVFWFGGSQRLITDTFLWCSYVVGPMWILFSSIVLWRYQKRGLAVLIGAPFALGPMAVYILLAAACIAGKGCL